MRILRFSSFLLLCLLGWSAAHAQLVFEESALKMGQVEWLSETTVCVMVRNKGSKPIAITDVRTSSGQLKAEWSKEAIAPDGSAQIQLTYKADLLGHYEKAVHVYTDEEGRTPYVMKAVGEVVREKRVDEGVFPYHVDNVWLTTDNIEFDDIPQGALIEQVIGVKNNGTSVYHPELMHLPKYLSQRAEPENLLPGRAGKLIVTLHSDAVEGFGLKQTTVYVSRFPGDRVGDNNEMEVSAVLLPPVDATVVVDSLRKPRLKVSTEELSLPSLAGRTKVKGVIVLTNEGKTPLEIRSIQVFNPAVNVNLSKTVILPGKSQKLKVSVLSKYMTKSRRRLRVLMTTNDVDRPKVFFNIKLAGQVDGPLAAQ